MSEFTKNLNLFKYDTSTDGKSVFSIDTSMNDNWDKIDAAFANAGSLDMFDVIQKDHVLSFEESKGYQLLGTYVYKNAIAGTRYGYPDFYNKCITEYNNSTNDEVVTNYNVTPVGGVRINSNGIASNFRKNVYLTGINVSNSITIAGTYKASTAIQTLWCPTTSVYPRLEMQTTGIIRWVYASGKYVTSTHTFNDGDEFVYNVVWNGVDTYTFNYKIGIGSSAIYADTTFSSTTDYFSGKTFNIGYNYDDVTYYWNGTIDLKNSNVDFAATNTYLANTTSIKINSNGHRFYDITNKSVFDDLYVNTGEAWYYGVDTENERIFLPRTTRSKYTTNTNEVGDCQEAGLPNITGSCGTISTNASQTGAFSGTFSGDLFDRGDSGGVGSWGTQYFDASLSNPIYGNSDTVEPSATKKLLYMIVGNTEVNEAITDVVDVTTTENDTIPPFTAMYFDFKPNSVSWLRGGVQQNREGLYEWTYNELVKCLNPADNKYELEVINEADMVGGTDYSTYWKVNQDQMYFITPTRTNERVLIAKKEATTDDPTWYNLYSDGWCEQGGKYDAGSNVRNVTVAIVFNRPFLSTTFNIFITGERDGEGNSSMSVGAEQVTTSTIQVHVYGATSSDLCRYLSWEAKGYTTIPQPSEYNVDINLYFKVANAVQNLELINVGQVTETLSNKVDINSTVIDGQWVTKTSILTQAVTAGTTIIDMSEYLPNDNYQYEVLLICAWAKNGSTNCTIYSDIIPQSTVMCETSSNGYHTSTYITIPIGTGRRLYQVFTSSANSDSDRGIEALAYRRVGTNR